jgi:site-specific DNA recombinase
MARVLGGARLSRETDASTSIERQTEQITLTTQVRGDELIQITTDTDISGAISPFAREGLGPWLIDPEKIAKWDILMVAKIDRLTRSLKDFANLIEWLDANGKVLVSVSESIDLSTSTGRMFCNLLVLFAEFERERIGERRREAGVKMRENGWWQGGQAPYGFVPVKVESHWELREDPTQSGIVYRMAREVIQGKARRAIGRDLTKDGIPTPKNAKEWGERTITKILTAEVSVLDDETREQVNSALTKTKVPWTKRGDVATLLNVAFCPCGEPLYARRWVHKPSGKLYEYYGCAVKCGLPNVPMQALDDGISLYFTSSDIPATYADYPVYRKIETKGKSPKSELATIERKMDSLDKDADDYIAQLTELSAERKRLQAQMSTPGSTRYEQIPDATVKDVWPQLDSEAKRELLIETGIKITNVTKVGSKLSFSLPTANPDMRFVVTKPL